MNEKTKKHIKRWYDNDSVLSKSMIILEESDDPTQIKIALNLIKVIIEHNIADSNYVGVDDILTAVEDGRIADKPDRWYDINTTLKTAIDMLAASPRQTQRIVAKAMAKIVIDKMKNEKDDLDN